MEVSFSPELQAKLEQLAADHGSDTSTLVVEAVERLIELEASRRLAALGGTTPGLKLIPRRRS
jgi:predicted transcriptional regulator